MLLVKNKEGLFIEATEKQQKLINAICNVLDVDFKGFTKGDATKFISENIEEFKRQQNIDNALNQILYDNYDFF